MTFLTALSDSELISLKQDWQQWHMTFCTQARASTERLRERSYRAMKMLKQARSLEVERERRKVAQNLYADVIKQWPAQDAPKKKEDVASLSKELVKCGELAQLTYDSMVNRNVLSSTFGSSLFERNDFIGGHRPFLGPDASKYKVIKLLYANAGAFKFVKRSPLSFSKKTYIGFVAHNAESAASSEGVDVVISWRGTVTDDEWHQDAKAFMVPWNDGNPLGISQPQARSIFNPLAVLGVRHLLALQLGHAALMHKFVVIPPSVALPVSIALLAFHALKGELSRGGLIMALGVTISAAHIGMLPLSVWTGLTLIPISIILGCLRVAQSSSWAASTLAEPYLAVLGDELKAYWNMAREWRAFLREAAYSCRNSDDACLAYGFREMYCECDDSSSFMRKRGSPRNQVQKALDQLFASDELQGKAVSSITTVGHSLGGALAAICAFDLNRCVLKGLQGEKGIDWAIPSAINGVKVTKSHAHRDIRITAVTFGAPRIGDLQFASEFGTPINDQQQIPGGGAAKIRVSQSRFDESFLQMLHNWSAKRSLEFRSALTRIFWIAAKAVLFYFIGWSLLWLLSSAASSLQSVQKEYLPFMVTEMARLVQIHATHSVSRICWSLVLLVLTWTLWWERSQLPVLLSHILMYNAPKSANQDKSSLRMIRVVNASDVVPRLPVGILANKSFVHGGLELRRNSAFFVDDVKQALSLSARHSLEVYMHLLDPTRDRALMNKSCDVLIPECGIPARWYSAVKDEGLASVQALNGRLASENVVLKQCDGTHNPSHPSNLGTAPRCGICVAQEAKNVR